ncbi:SDR family NAD(P)-dependent oxidoreductase [Mucilaginibacter sp. PAMB04274]|uniref:SDR family NAD(P)-dependent oxidoreductase n=1 Tax=Mucilaginibacter sp. PAMB04274 TaxID=3138568 RepID=UPI0031F64C29
MIAHLLNNTNGCLSKLTLAVKQSQKHQLKQFYISFAFCLLVGFMLTGCATAKLGSSGQAKVKGKTYVIVGASSGFGRGVAEQLGSYGANVVLASRRTNLLEEVAGKVRANGGTAMVVTTDISKPDDVQNLAAAVVKQYGKVDVWVNMSGVGAIGRFWEIPLEDQAKVIDVNLKGVIYASYAAVKLFKAQGYGTLINMGSVESESPLAYHATYAATKGAILKFDEALSQELRLSGLEHIKVVTVEPWAVDTPFWGHAANYSGGTARMAAMDGPEKVVNAVIRVSLRPRKELPVGWKARGARNSHRLFPRFTEWLSGNIVHKQQYKKSMPKEATSGSVHQPMSTGRGVEGGVRDRMKKENEEKKKQR